MLLKGLLDNDLIALNENEGVIRKEIRRVITGELKIGQHIDESVRKKLLSFSRKLTEGSPEWDVLYKKFYEEEEIRKGKK